MILFKVLGFSTAILATVGMLSQGVAELESPTAAGGWLAGGTVTGVLSWLLSRTLTQSKDERERTATEHSATLQRVVADHRSACDSIATSHAESSDKVVNAVKELGGKIDTYHQDTMRIQETLAGRFLEAMHQK